MKYKLALLTLILSQSVLAADELNFVSMQNGVPNNTIKSNSSANAQVNARAAGGQVRKEIKLQTWHRVNISNITDHKQNWNYVFKMCVAGKKDCISKDFNISLNPGDSYEDTKTIDATAAFYQTGNYPMHGETIINGEFSDSTKDYNTVTVYN